MSLDETANDEELARQLQADEYDHGQPSSKKRNVGQSSFELPHCTNRLQAGPFLVDSTDASDLSDLPDDDYEDEPDTEGPRDTTGTADAPAHQSNSTRLSSCV
jgi:hypothetical protein